jgi:general secretion pathway protein D
MKTRIRMTDSYNEHRARVRLTVPPRVHRFAIATLAALLTLVSQAAEQQATITPNFKDADIAQVVEAVKEITGKTFIIDPRVRAQVTMLSTTPMSPSAFYQAFLSILQVHGFVAVPSGNVIKIIPDANARQVPADDLPNQVSSTSDEIVTQVVAVHNVSASQLVPPLRPLIPQYGHLVAVPGANLLIISDHANNVSRLMRIIARIDQAGDDSIDIVQLQNASATEIVRVVNTLFTGAGAQGAEPGAAAKVVADDRTNSVLITGEQSQRLRLKALITNLDTPLESGGDTQVRYLRYSEAKTMAGKLKEQIQGIVQSTPGGAPAAAAAAGSNAERGVSIWSDETTNALIVTAPPKVMRQIMSIVDKLDIRRPQVRVEAILVEMNSTKAAQLGVNWVLDGSNDAGNTVPIGTFNQDIGGSSIGSIAATAAALQNSSSAAGGALAATQLPTGLTLGAGRFMASGVNFAVLLRALRNDATTNIISTPSILTLDNQEAQIKVAQEVPFITGQYTSGGGTGTSATGNVNPFQTIQREEVGTILKITPQISEGETVLLKIDQEASGIAQSIQGAADLITNKRTISTKVMVEDGGIIVLGGLLDDRALEGEQRVPVLGAIPLIGELFKVRNGQKEKNNLMLFIRPTILRDGVQAAYVTNAKYNELRDIQRGQRKGKVTLLPGEHQPTLTPLEEVSRFADPEKASTEQPGQSPPVTNYEDKVSKTPTTTTPLPVQSPPPPSAPSSPPGPQPDPVKQ